MNKNQYGDPNIPDQPLPENPDKDQEYPVELPDPKTDKPARDPDSPEPTQPDPDRPKGSSKSSPESATSMENIS